MRKSIFISLFFAAIFLCGGCSSTQEYDIVIYGGTSAAVTAAVQAKRMGQSVVIVSPDKHLGGMTGSGLTCLLSATTRLLIFAR
ncbi:MAG: FAD-dependent oxidoreductase [Dysgonamonadaceae bacterium]|nr:FAD-dependent oxidoreductase [Dysgonamonadaceae bacterium]